MPNWVECTLQITGAPAIVSDCLASMGSPEGESEDARLFDFERVVPLPPELREAADAPANTPDDYWRIRAWVVELWGTKWNASEVAVDRQPDGGGARIRFHTAWCPPLPVIETLAERFPSLDFDLRYLDVQAPIGGRCRREPGQGWATIEARSDYGLCYAAFDAESWDPFANDAAPAQD